ncbi:TetR family transcriptional regulator [Nocardia otitidiscaviarum]|uniref:TetR family transcriptional regulator n=1 Tax=Nocardia otitidiscaviarum TaxID=1823 RepID=A0A516NRT6_9NOCA|nr:TetR family transcriptional regulator [Nocardia otitidiscaviarum]MCP9620761.1 TetR family transcriptional regulator [Nocardia otitidiscaviarum]QDP81564.1 TetR family transcriptional regulator [Nocardia otitidiscaviarum]
MGDSRGTPERGDGTAARVRDATAGAAKARGGGGAIATARRLTVVDQALRLFAEKGYEATTVDEIAEAAGISRRTFFRQFRAKEDVVFADHESQLAQAREFLDGWDGDPWAGVLAAVVGVFERFTQWRELAARRYRVVRQVPALREREIVTVFRYERLFTDYLRERLRGESDLALVQFTAAVTATHNYLLRRMVRGESDASPADLRAALDAIPRGVVDAADESDQLVVAVFPRTLSPRQVADLLARRLDTLD